MSLPVPNLDDRRFQDLVDEAKRMIPSLLPEWTNHNVSDPGVALIELFAWMSEQVIYRLNQVPERLYVDFLNLLGTAPFPASAARAPMTFWLSAATSQVVVVPAGTEITTAGGGGVVFATVDTLRIEQPVVTAALTSTRETVYTDVLPQLRYDRDTVTCFTSVAPNDAFILGFDTSLAGLLVELTIETAKRGTGVDPDRVPIVWEVWSGERWIPTDVIDDTTGGLNRGGTIRLIVPAMHESLLLAGQRRYWLRVRLLKSSEGQPTFQTSPTLTTVTTAALGGTVTAEHSRTVRGEALGSSDGTPGQRFVLANRPVLPRRDGEEVLVTVGDDEHRYDEVTDFSASGPSDRHVVFDDAAGTIEFGPRIRYPDGTNIQHGAVPPFGAHIALTAYRTGGGSAGNVAAGTLTKLRAAIPYVDKVANLQAARGGVDAESVDEVKIRGPRSLRTGQRAVTRSDFEQLTLESSPQVARARCIVPETPLEPVRVLVVPASDRDARTLNLDDFALTPDLFSTVSRHLDERRTVGSVVEVSAPYYQGVSVVVRLRAAAGRETSAVRDRVEAAIASFLSPLGGGVRRQGWPFGVDLNAAALLSLVEEVAGVASVDELALFEYDLRNGRRLGDMVDVITLDPPALFLSGGNQVVVR